MRLFRLSKAIQNALRLSNPRRKVRRKIMLESLEARQFFAIDVQPIVPVAPHEHELGIVHMNSLFAEGEGKVMKTWSIVEDGTPTNVANKPTQLSNLQATLTSLYGTPEKWLSVFQSAFDAWDEVSGVKFVYMAEDDSAVTPGSPAQARTRADIRIAGVSIDGGGGILAEAHTDQDIVFDSDLGIGDAFLKQLYVVALHEIGHVLGLEHNYVMAEPVNGNLPDTLRSIMQPAIDQIVGVALHSEDIRNIQMIYGDGYEPNDTTATAIELGKAVEGATIADTLSINGNGDVDRFNLKMTAGQSLNVRVSPTGFIYKHGSSLDALTTIDASRQSKLILEVSDPTGQNTRVVTANALGDSVLIENFAATTDGVYSIVIRSNGTNLQQYRLAYDVGVMPEFNPRQNEKSIAPIVAQVNAATDRNDQKTIPLERGIYKLNAPLIIRGNVRLVGQGSSATILDGQKLSNILFIDEGATLVLEGVTLTRGITVGENINGGAIYTVKGKVRLDDVILIDNQAVSKGGAIFVSAGELHLNNVLAMYNRAGNGTIAPNGTPLGEGGAVYLANSVATISNSRFNDNVADNSGGAVSSQNEIDIATSQFVHNRAGSGGAISISYEGGNSRIHDSWIINNSAVYAGGIGLGAGHTELSLLRIEGNRAEARTGGVGVADNGSFSMTDSYVAYNFALAAAGVGVGRNLNRPPSRESIIRNSWIRGNRAVSSSGGVGVTGFLRIESSTISENVAEQWFGGGVATALAGARLLAINSTISLNQSNGYGAGVSAFDRSEINLIQTTVTGNRLLADFSSASFANQGAGVHVHTDSKVSAVNSIIADNGEGGYIPDIYGDITLTHSLVGFVDDQTVADLSGKGNILGTANQRVKARLSVLTDNGGKTPTHQLFADSPAIDAGLSISTITTDQTGQTRGRPDMGAYEFRKTDPTPQLSPTLDAIVAPTSIDHTAGAQKVTLTGIGVPGIANPKIAPIARSSNVAVVGRPTVTLSPTANGQAELTFTPVEGTKGTATITVAIIYAGADGTYGSADDAQVERSFTVNITNADANALPILAMEPADKFEPREGTETMAFTLWLSAASTSPVSVRLRSQSGTATSGADFDALDTTITFQPGETTKTVNVTVRADDTLEPTEIFTIALDQVVGASLATPVVIGTLYDAPIVLGSPLLPPIAQNPNNTPVIFVPARAIGPTSPAPREVRETKPKLVGRLLASELQLTDVDRSGQTVSFDALLLINILNLRNDQADRTQQVAFSNELIAYDVNRDQFITPLDALLIINELNSQGTTGGGGATAEGEPAVSQPSAPDDHAMAVDLALLEDFNRERRTARRS